MSSSAHFSLMSKLWHSCQMLKKVTSMHEARITVVMLWREHQVVMPVVPRVSLQGKPMYQASPQTHLHSRSFCFLICILGGGSKVHSTLRPLNGLLFQPWVIMIMEKSVEWLAGETEVLGENLPQCRFVHHKPHMLILVLSDHYCDYRSERKRSCLRYYCKRVFFFPMALQPFLGPWPHISVSKSLYTDCRTPWTSDQPVARHLPIHRTTQTQKNAQTYKHPCLE
jgi:hypothetical protein